MSRRSYWDWGFVVIFAAAVLYQVLVSPVIGLPDNGDFHRMTTTVGLKVVDNGDAGGFASFARYYALDPAVKGKPFPSSELLFVLSSLGISALVSKSGLFDITSLGAVHAVAYIFAACLIAYAGFRTRHPLRWGIYAAILVLFTDIAYTSYFNSFYAESGCLILLCAIMGFALVELVKPNSDPPSRIPLAGFFICSMLFLTTKLQNVMLGPFIAVGMYLLCRRHARNPLHKAIPWTRLGVCGAVAIVGVVLAYWTLYSIFPMGIRNTNVYDSVFFEIVKNSPNPELDLKELGLDASYIKYSGTTAWSRGITPEIYSRVYENVKERQITRFYVKHPKRLLGLLWRSAKHGFDTRPGYLGNFDCYTAPRLAKMLAFRGLKPGESPFAESTSFLKLPGSYFSHSFALSSGFKERFLTGSAWPLLIFLLLNVAVIFVKWFRFDRTPEARGITAIHACLIFTAALQFLTCTVGAGELDLIKHLFLFDLQCDLCTVFLVGYALHMFAGCRCFNRKALMGVRGN